MYLFGVASVGFCFGGFLALYPAVPADYFGTKNVGANYGFMFMAYGAGGLFGPWLAPKLMVIGFRPNPPVDAQKIIELVQKNRHIKLAGNDKLRIEREIPEAKDRAQMIRDVLRALGTPRQNQTG